MLKSEFEKLAGVVVSDYQYKIIEQKYIATDEDKAAFAKRYKDNNNSLATVCCRQEDEQIAKLKESFEKYSEIKTLEIDNLKKQIQKMTEQLDKELEWEPFVPVSEVQQEEYERGKTTGGPLSIEGAIEAVCDEFGFDPAKVRILTTAPAYEKNRHGVVRAKNGSETIDRAPYWCATDDNYIRFTCALWTYEMFNGELHQI